MYPSLQERQDFQERVWDIQETVKQAGFKVMQRGLIGKWYYITSSEEESDALWIEEWDVYMHIYDELL